MKDYLRRHIWILSELYRHPKVLTYKEFAERWERSSQNVLGTSLPKRAFTDCLRAIEETFDIEPATATDIVLCSMTGWKTIELRTGCSPLLP